LKMGFERNPTPERREIVSLYQEVGATE
jgi:hypothetical protein